MLVYPPISTYICFEWFYIFIIYTGIYPYIQFKHSNMKIKKLINIDQVVVDNLVSKYPGVPFNKLVERALDKLLGEDSTEVPTTDNEQLKIMIQDYNKLKASYRQFKDDIDNRIVVLETRLK